MLMKMSGEIWSSESFALCLETNNSRVYHKVGVDQKLLVPWALSTHLPDGLRVWALLTGMGVAPGHMLSVCPNVMSPVPLSF